MPNNPNKPPASSGPIWAAGAALAAAGLIAYANSFSVPFLFDDAPAVLANPTIRHLWPSGSILNSPANGATSAGRPVLNLSLALNYAWGGLHVQGYHAWNLLIHILAGVTLFGIVRRTLGRCPRESGRVTPTAGGFAVALLWLVHPLQTESVTYIAQRAESLMGLFYFLTLYGFIRYATDDAGSALSRRGWAALALVACFLGMATKEVMVSAPLVVLLYDRTFLSGGFGAAWRRHRGILLGLAGSWLLLAYLVLREGDRGGSAGFGQGMGVGAYALTQCQAIVLYLKLAVWPHPLVFDYGVVVAPGWSSVWPQALLLAALLAGTAWGLVRRPVLGFLGAWFFLILAPSSSFVPVVTQTLAEHRVYLPLAAIALLAVLGLSRVAGRYGFPWVGLLAAGLTGLTVARNRVYRNEASLWSDVIAHYPGNPRAHYNLGLALGQAHESGGAIAQYREALRLAPDYAQAHNNLAGELAGIPGRRSEAIAHYEAALRLRPNNAAVEANLAEQLAKIPGREREAIAHYQAALRLDPADAAVHNNLGVELARFPDRADEAMAQYREALRLQPSYAEAENNLATVLAGIPGRLPEAIADYEEALRLKPDYPEAHFNLGNKLTRIPGRLPEAGAHYEAAVRLRPDFVEARTNLAVVYAATGRWDEAMRQLAIALQLRPSYQPAQRALARFQALRGR